RNDARVVLIGISVHMFARGSVHLHVLGSGHIYTDLDWVIEPDAVFDNLRLQTSGAELARDIICGRLIFGRARDVRRLGQNAQVFFGELGVRELEKTLFQAGFSAGVAKAEDRRGAIVRFWTLLRFEIGDGVIAKYER